MQTVRRCVAGDGAEIAYAVSGDGPPLVMPAWWISDLELDWNDPEWQALFDMLGANHTVVRYDRPGVGQSACERQTFTLDEEVDYLRAVTEDLDMGPAAMVAMSCGGPPAVRLAVERPDLVDRLVLYASYADGQTIAPEDAREAIVALVRSTWGSVGSRALADIFLPSADRSQIVEFAEYQRNVATPKIAAELLQLTYDMDVTDVAGQVRCPVLVVHRRRDRAIRRWCGRHLAELIPDAEYVELEGTEHSMANGDSAALVREIERFLLGYTPVDYTRRELATVLFTDIVDSTPLASGLGDDAWRSRLDDHDRITCTAVEHNGGRVVKSTGDGVLAVFSLPAGALACARALHRELRAIGIRITAGIHVGEVERRGDDVAGLAVNIAARVMGRASEGQTLVTSTVRDISAGSGFAFRDVETTPLKGLEGTFTLCEIA